MKVDQTKVLICATKEIQNYFEKKTTFMVVTSKIFCKFTL